MYLLDTNICIYLIKNKYQSLSDYIKSIPTSDLLISYITVAELEFGVAKSQFPQRN